MATLFDAALTGPAMGKMTQAMADFYGRDHRICPAVPRQNTDRGSIP